jgi:GT2 family glycosyltransferase
MTLSSHPVGQAEHLTLEMGAVRALAERDFAAAFRMADRRCRISPPAEAHAYVLRAEAAFRIGQRRGAITDLRRAVAIAPNDIPANRRLLAWGRGKRRRDAALALIASDSDARILAEAVSVAGVNRPLGALRVYDDRIRGWAAWATDARVEVVVRSADGGTTALFIDADPAHPLGGGGHAASFDLPRPRARSAHFIDLVLDDVSFASVYAPPNDRQAAPPLPDTTRDSVTVIVPVYRDYEASRACLDALLAELGGAPRHRAIIVNDATPDRRIAAYLDRVAGDPGVTVLTNASNRGFVGSVNRALLEVAAGDVILLNADTLPPPGFIDRLAAAAHNQPGIGTVVPFSNNGELTSFHRGGEELAIPSVEDVAEVDAAARRANAARIVDIPAGTGFCLYITRACLSAVGLLSEAFHFGYFEDIDFGLRARERGFRAVCATSIYVGHAGSRSFGAHKRSLVAKNFPILAERFPDYPRECAAFDLADPLGPMRSAIERELPSRATGLRLLIHGPGLDDVCRERARQLSGAGKKVAMLRIMGGAETRAQALEEALVRLAPSAIELVDPASTPLRLLDLILETGVPLDLAIADDGLFRIAADAGAERQIRWAMVRSRARYFLALNRRAAAYAARHLSRDELSRIRCLETERPQRRLVEASGLPRLGAIPSRSSPLEARVLRAVAAALAVNAPMATMTIFGDVAIDAGLSDLDNTFVTGAVGANELERMFRQYEIGCVLAGFGRPLFGHPVTERTLAAGRPVATIDWSGERAGLEPPDLALDSRAAPGEIAAAVVSWMAGDRR